MLLKHKSNKDFDKERQIIDLYAGLCHVFCQMVAVMGHNDVIIKNLVNENTNHDNEIQIVHKLIHQAYFVQLLNIIEKILMVLFNKFPKSIISLKKQKQFLNRENNVTKSINPEMLQKIFDKMKINQYVQLGLLKTKKSGIKNKVTAGHFTLILKTQENNKTLYNFFEPNLGFFQSEDVNDIARIFNLLVIESRTDYNILGTVNVNQITKRSQYGETVDVKS